MTTILNSILSRFIPLDVSKSWRIGNQSAARWKRVYSKGNLIIAPTFDKGMFRSIDNGENWSNITSGLITTNLISVSGSDDASTLVTARFNGLTYVSSDQGLTWVNKGAARPFQDTQVSPDGTYIWTTDNPGYVWRSIDKGAMWTSLVAKTAFTKLTIGRNGFAIVVDTTLGQPSYKTSNNFITNSVLTGVYNNYAVRTAGISRSGNVAYINLKGPSNQASYVQRSFDNGVTWETMYGLGTRKFADIGVSEDGKIVVLVETLGDVFISEDYGSTFTAQGFSATVWESVFVEPNGSKIIASITNGYLWIYD